MEHFLHHEIRVSQLKGSVEAILENINSPSLLTRLEGIEEEGRLLRRKLKMGLLALKGFRDAFEEYELLMRRLVLIVEEGEVHLESIALQHEPDLAEVWVKFTLI